MNFVHLHLHTEYSFLDGSIKIKDLFNRVKELGQNAVAITEHGHMHALVQKYKLAKAAGIKLIVGAEVYLCDDISVKDKKRYHFLLLAENNEGLQNLNKILSIASTEGFYYKPRVDKNILRKYSKGLIASSACIGGDIPRAINNNNLDKARELAKEYVEIFGKNNFFLEVHNHGIPEEETANKGIIQISKELDIPIIAANDAHYLKEEDATAHDILLCIQTKKKVDDEKRMRFSGTGFHIKSTQEMQNLFPENPEFLENTQKIADRCNVEIDLGNTYFPEFELPAEETYETMLTKLCYKGLDEKYKKGTQLYEDATERLKYELGVIKKMGFSAYFLIVADFIDEAKKFCQVGPGRGCVLPDTYVTLSNGKQKQIKNIKISDKIITHSGNIEKVLNVMKYPCDEEIVSLKIASEELNLTSDHKIWALKSQKCSVKGEKLGICKPSCSRKCSNKLYENYKLEWIESGKLNKDDFVVFPRNKSNNKEIQFDLLDYIKDKENIKYDDKFIWYEIGTNKIKTKKTPRIIKFNKSLAKFLGYYIAEGWSRTTYRKGDIGFGFHEDETEYANEVQILFKEIFDLDSQIIFHKTKKSLQIKANSKIVGLFLEKICGKGALNKNIYDDIVLNGKDEHLKTFISYMFRGDGYDGRSNKNINIKYSTVSRNLAYQLRLLLARFGYWTSIIERKNQKNKNWNIEYSVKLSGKQLLNWNNDFTDFSIPITKQKFFRNDSFYVTDDNIFIKIKDVDKKKYDGFVYDISVTKDKSYIANSIAIHNSGAGSIVAYLLGITQLEPLKLHLLFERFLNPERVSLPDFDVDFGDRDKVLDYIRNKYGEDKVALIGTYGTMMAKACLKDVARAIGIPFEVSNEITKHVTEKTIKKSLEAKSESGKLLNPELTDYKTKYPFLFEIAEKLEGTVRQPGIHACGVVWGPEKIDYYTSVFKKDANTVTQMDKNEVEDRGLVKFDFLGLETLNIIQQVLEFIGKDGKWLEEIPIDDQNVYNLLTDAKSVGVFQLESAGMQKTLKLIKPTCFDDIIAIVALYRPGPMQYLEVYANRKHEREQPKYPHPWAEEILGPTYGIMVYQEQVMQLAQKLAGFTMGQADVLRKAIGKKKLDLMQQMEGKFKEGCMTVAKMDKKVVDKLWDDIVKFASYSFNKSHAAAYALISYRTAYLKTYYPLEFYTAIISSVTDDTEKMAFYIQEARDDNIKILTPSINKSERGFSFEKKDGQNIIRFGLSGIKNVGETAIDEIINNRPYTSYIDFINKVDLSKVNKRVQKHLILCNAFDEFGYNRCELMNAYENIKPESPENKTQKTLFGGFVNSNKIEIKDEYPLGQILQHEIETLGLPITANLLDQYPVSRSGQYDKLAKLMADEQSTCFVLVKAFRQIQTKKGDDMAFIEVYDRTAVITAVVFPKAFMEISHLKIEENMPLVIEGTLREQSFIVSSVEPYNRGSAKRTVEDKKEEEVKVEKKKGCNLMDFC